MIKKVRRFIESKRKKNRQFVVKKIWYVKAKNPRHAIKVAEIIEHNILEVSIEGRICYDEQNESYE